MLIKEFTRKKINSFVPLEKSGKIQNNFVSKLETISTDDSNSKRENILFTMRLVSCISLTLNQNQHYDTKLHQVVLVESLFYFFTHESFKYVMENDPAKA